MSERYNGERHSVARVEATMRRRSKRSCDVRTPPPLRSSPFVVNDAFILYATYTDTKIDTAYASPTIDCAPRARCALHVHSLPCHAIPS